jgi:hypothetical protein|eukprot:COSAG06_NODE_282_length_18378_cov_85.787461_16_plen_194_part_00
MCDATRIRVLADKVESEMLERTGKQRQHMDVAAMSILSRAPLSEPSRDHTASLTPWRQRDSWQRATTPRETENAGKAALPQGFARPPWRGTQFPSKVERPGSLSLFSTAKWQMDDYSRASDMNRAWKITDRRKIRSGPFRACSSEDSLGQLFTRPQSQVRSARPKMMGGSLAVGYKLPSLSARQPRPPATARH